MLYLHVVRPISVLGVVVASAVSYGQTTYSYTYLNGDEISFDSLPAAETAMRADFNNNGRPGDKLRHDKSYTRKQSPSYPNTEIERHYTIDWEPW